MLLRRQYCHIYSISQHVGKAPRLDQGFAWAVVVEVDIDVNCLARPLERIGPHHELLPWPPCAEMIGDCLYCIVRTEARAVAAAFAGVPDDQAELCSSGCQRCPGLVSSLPIVRDWCAVSVVQIWLCHCSKAEALDLFAERLCARGTFTCQCVYFHFRAMIHGYEDCYVAREYARGPVICCRKCISYRRVYVVHSCARSCIA